MNNGIYLFLVYSLIPLGVLVVVLLGQPLLTAPQRALSRISAEGARALSVTLLTIFAIGLMMFLAFRLILGY